jgi:hypothetical protein
VEETLPGTSILSLRCVRLIAPIPLEQYSKEKEMVTLFFGQDKHAFKLDRFIANEMPTIWKHLDEDYELTWVHLKKEAKLSDSQRRGIDLLLNIKLAHEGHLLNPDLADSKIILEALHWAHYLGLNDLDLDVGTLLGFLTRILNLPEDIQDELQDLIQKGFITSDYWRRKFDRTFLAFPEHQPGRRSLMKSGRPPSPLSLEDFSIKTAHLEGVKRPRAGSEEGVKRSRAGSEEDLQDGRAEGILSFMQSLK